MRALRNHFIVLIILLFCAPLSAIEGDSVLITKNFKFKDGLFVTYEDFKQNRPSFTWDQLDYDLFANPQTFITRVQFIKTKDGKAIDLNQVWGMSIDGIPHIRLEKGILSNDLFVFVSIKVRGKICYFSYEEEKEEMVTIKAYNPLTRKPFRSGQVERTVEVVQERMFDFETGAVEAFTLDSFLKAIQKDDPLLADSIKDLNGAEAQQKLFKCLLIYVDRHAVFTNE